jgi:hypothetical protein
MWELKDPSPVKLVIAILSSDAQCLDQVRPVLVEALGPVDLVSDVWPFVQTAYYADQAGQQIVRQFVSIEKLVDPGVLADMKHRTNEIEQELAHVLDRPFPRPVNLDPGVIEPSKLILATTKNYSHRIYIGKKMYAEVTLVFDKGGWRPLPYTYPDYRQRQYFDFFTQVREKLLRQLRSTRQANEM